MKKIYHKFWRVYGTPKGHAMRLWGEKEKAQTWGFALLGLKGEVLGFCGSLFID